MNRLVLMCITVIGLSLALSCKKSGTPENQENPASGNSVQECKVTYVANSGFLVQAGDQKIAIDAFFNYKVPATVLNLIREGKPPFDGIDLILATHDHADHFDPGLVGTVLKNNPDAVFAAPGSASSQITGFGDRVVSIDLKGANSANLKVHGIQVEAVLLNHDVEGYVNLGYLITLGGRTIFHIGDWVMKSDALTVLEEFGIPEKKIDLAFIHYYFLCLPEFHSAVRQGVHWKYLLPIHFYNPEVDFETITRYFPDAIILRNELDSWTMPLDP